MCNRCNFLLTIELQDNELIEMTGKWKNWDIPSSFALNDLAKAVDHAALEVGPNGVVIIEGLLMFSHPELSRHYRAVVSMELPVDCWKARRFARDEWIQKNEEYFSDVVLPAYQEHGLVPESEHYKLLRVDATSTPDILHPQVFATLEQWRAER